MSKNYNIKKWIEKIILSCENLQQIDTSKNLILNFKKKMKNEGYDYMLSKPFIVDLKKKLKQKKWDLIKEY